MIASPLVNQAAAHALISTSGITNSQPVAASLTVAAGIAIQKTFMSQTLPSGSTKYVRSLITAFLPAVRLRITCPRR